MATSRLKKRRTTTQRDSAPPKQRTPETLTVTVSKTVQIKQFEPATVTITEIHQLTDGDDARRVRSEVYSNISKSVVRMINNEIAVHGNIED